MPAIPAVDLAARLAPPARGKRRNQPGPHLRPGKTGTKKRIGFNTNPFLFGSNLW